MVPGGCSIAAQNAANGTAAAASHSTRDPFPKSKPDRQVATRFSNGSRVLYEAAAAVPFTAFCAAAEHPIGTSKNASGYRVMGYPGAAPNGYYGFSYRRKLSKERTKKGYLP